MQTIFDNEYIKLEMDLQKSLYIYTWKPESEFMTIENMFEYAKISFDTVKMYSIRNVIASGKDFKFPVVPAIQDKLNESIFNALNKGSIRKFAHVVSRDILSRMSLEQLFDDIKEKTFQDMYFEDLSQAIAWCDA